MGKSEVRQRRELLVTRVNDAERNLVGSAAARLGVSAAALLRDAVLRRSAVVMGVGDGELAALRGLEKGGVRDGQV